MAGIRYRTALMDHSHFPACCSVQLGVVFKILFYVLAIMAKPVTSSSYNMTIDSMETARRVGKRKIV